MEQVLIIAGPGSELWEEDMEAIKRFSSRLKHRVGAKCYQLRLQHGERENGLRQ